MLHEKGITVGSLHVILKAFFRSIKVVNFANRANLFLDGRIVIAEIYDANPKCLDGEKKSSPFDINADFVHQF